MPQYSTKNKKLEKELIETFKEEFYKKIGYYPIITTQVIENQDDIQIMSLNDLETYFIECFRDVYPQVIRLRKKDRHREVVDLRSLFTHFARVMRYKYAAIGRFLGTRHHTTILHYNIVFNDQMATNSDFRSMYNQIFNYIKEKSKSNELSIMEYTNPTRIESKPDVLS